MGLSPSLPGPAANLSISASFCAGSVAALISVNAWSTSDPAWIGTYFPICCAGAERTPKKTSMPMSHIFRRIKNLQGEEIGCILVLRQAWRKQNPLGATGLRGEHHRTRVVLGKEWGST